VVDRKSRDQMARAIRSHMDEEMTAFQFDDALNGLMDRTEDRTVREAGEALWYHYDDCKDHNVVATKEQWAFFNRILLLLESDAELEIVSSQRQWHPLQAVAAVLLMAFTGIAFGVGFGAHLFAYALPFGPPSMLIAWLNTRRRRATCATESVLAPFPSMASLLSVRRQVRGFVKKRYPSSISNRRTRGPLFDKLMLVPSFVAWCVFSPAVLLVQMLPKKTSQKLIRTPEQRIAGS
jgi:hypothetical protein